MSDTTGTSTTSKNRQKCLPDTTRSSYCQIYSKNTHEINGNGKRIRSTIKKCANRVTFATEDVYIDGYTPYESGISDADVIRLYHNDIWYTVSSPLKLKSLYDSWQLC